MPLSKARTMGAAGLSGSGALPTMPPVTTTRNTNSNTEKGKIERQIEKEREQAAAGSSADGATHPLQIGGSTGAAGGAECGADGGVSATHNSAIPSVAGLPVGPGAGGSAAKSLSNSCVRWCMNVVLQSFAGEPWAVNLGPAAADVMNNSFTFSCGNSATHGPSTAAAAPEAGGAQGSAAPAANTAATGTTAASPQVTAPALPRHQTTTAASRAASELNAHNGVRSPPQDSGMSGTASVPSTTTSTNGAAPIVNVVTTGAGRAGESRADASRSESAVGATSTVGANSTVSTSANHAVYGTKYGTEVSASQRCGLMLSIVDWDQDEVAAAVSATEDGEPDAGEDASRAGAPPYFGPPQEELQMLQQCVMEVNDPPVTYGCDELLNRITNAEFIPTVVERADPDSGYVDSQMHYHLRSSLEPLLNSTVKPAVTAVVDHCVSSMVLVYGATQEMKQMGLIGTPEECGLLPHAIRLFMERCAERKEQQDQVAAAQQQQRRSPTGSKQSSPESGGANGSPGEQDGAAGGRVQSPAYGNGSPDSRSASTSTTMSNFVLPQMGSRTHHYVRTEATFIAFDSSSVADLLDLDNKHVELALQLAPPPTPAAFEDNGNDDMPRSTSTPTTDSYVLNARAMAAENTNDALSALDIGLENLSRALEKASLQSESGSSLLFSLTAYTDNCRCATMHVLCLAEDPAAQTWLASTVLARSQAIPLGEEQSWASIQNTPMPPPLHHHAATLLVPALCFGNMFTSVLVCVYNSMTALSRLNRDLTLAVTGYRMRTIPRVSLVSSRRGGKVPLPPGWEEHFTEDGRRYYTDTSTLATTWQDPRFRQKTNGASGGGGGGGSGGRAGSGAGAGEGAGGGGRDGSGSGHGGGEAGGGDSANGASTGVTTPPSSGHRPSRIRLADGDRDFLASKLHQTDPSGTPADGASALNSPQEGASQQQQPFDIGIVVVDAAGKPRVVLSSENVNFTEQLAKEEKLLEAERARAAALMAERHHRREARLRENAEKKEAALQREKAAAAPLQPVQELGSSGGPESGPVSEPLSTTTTTTTTANTTTVTSSVVSGVPTANESIVSAAGRAVRAGEAASSVTPLVTVTAAPSQVNGAGLGALELDGGTERPPPHEGVDDARFDSSSDSEMSASTGSADSSHTPASTHAPAQASAPDNGSTEALVQRGEKEEEEGSNDKRATADGEDDDDGDGSDDDFDFGRCRAPSSTADDFGLDEASAATRGNGASADIPALTSAQMTATINTARFYSNAMQEQIAAPLQSSTAGAIGATVAAAGAAGAPGSAGPTNPAAEAAPKTVNLTPEMQDLESLVEEFTAFFKRSYDSEQRVRALEGELEELRFLTSSSPTTAASPAGSSTAKRAGASSQDGAGGRRDESSHDGTGVGGGRAGSMGLDLNSSGKQRMLRKIEDALNRYGTPALWERLEPCFDRSTRVMGECAADAPTAAVAQTSNDAAAPPGPLGQPIRRVLKHGAILPDFLIECWDCVLRQYQDVEGQLKAVHRSYYSNRVTQLCEDSRALVQRWGDVHETEIARLRGENEQLRQAVRAQQQSTPTPATDAGLLADDGARDAVELPTLKELLAQHHELFLDALPENNEDDEEYGII